MDGLKPVLRAARKENTIALGAQSAGCRVQTDVFAILTAAVRDAGTIRFAAIEFRPSTFMARFKVGDVVRLINGKIVEVVGVHDRGVEYATDYDIFDRTEQIERTVSGLRMRPIGARRITGSP